MRIAWLTPFSRRSAIAKYSAEVVAELRTRSDVTVFASDLSPGQERWSWLPYARPRCILGATVDELVDQLNAFDLLVYNLGNNLYLHRIIYELALIRPGIIVLHDFVMHHFFGHFFQDYRQDPEGYVAELALVHGAAGEAFARELLPGSSVDTARDPRMLLFNMAASAIHRSEGVVVHSEFARRAIADVAESPVVHIPFPAPRMARIVRSFPTDGKQAGDTIRLLSFGMVNRNKLITEVMAAIADGPDLRKQVIYHVLGPLDDADYAGEVREAIESHDLSEVVSLLGDRTEQELIAYLTEADLVLNLRNPHFGESSWSLLEALFAGKPTLVWKHGTFDELPDDVVAKISRLDELGPLLEELCRDEVARTEMGERARSFALQTFSTVQYCDRFLAFAARTRYNRPILQLTDTVATALAELWQAPESAATRLAASEIAAMAGVDDQRDG